MKQTHNRDIINSKKESTTTPNYTQNDVNLAFIKTKGFDITTTDGLEKALEWLQSTDPDNLMLGEPTGDPFDRQMGEFRRSMLIETVEEELFK